MEAPLQLMHESAASSIDPQSHLATGTETPVINGSHQGAPNESAAPLESGLNNSTAFDTNSSIENKVRAGDVPSDIPAPAPASGLDASLPAEASGIQPVSAFLPKETISGIQPVSDFLPKETTSDIQPVSDFLPSGHSHPTPPPENAPLREEDVKPEVPVDVAPQPSADGAPTVDVQLPALPVDTSMTGVSDAGESLLNGVSQPAETPITPQTATEPTAVLAENATSSLVRQREDDADEDGPAAKRNKFEDDVKPEVTDPDSTMQDAPPTAEPATPTSAVADNARYFTSPLTDVQKTFLIEKTKNLKKTKHAMNFLAPVDVVKLNIPNYLNIIKKPMDLTTLETKLKNDEYPSAQAYADDFNMIVYNCRTFNGDAHPITTAAFNMEATFKKYMSALPNPQQTAPVKALKRASPAAPRPQPRREVRQPPAPIAQSPSATAQTFALQADGTPQIRRDSTNTKRPHRTIKPPQSRELPYAKPKRKEHQLELKFCEYVLDQLRGPSFSLVNQAFLVPVDPVALNIPHYRQIVKKPMDLATMAQKLKSGQYGTAKEFRADFELMIENCLAFNPPGNPVRDLGIEMKRGFEQIWKDKEKWERNNKKSSERATSESDSEEDEDDDEDDDDPAANAQATIAALTKQLAELQKTVAAAAWSKDGKRKKDKKRDSKKGSFSGATKKSKVKAPKKVKAPTYEEKQEISNAVTQMNDAQINRLTQIITDNCEKYRNMGDDMELEIDDLPNDVQILLLRHVRSIFGNPNRGARMASPDDLAAEDDDDFAPPARDRAAAGGKRKKHKPMGKKEQQENIAALKSQLAAFNTATSGSESPTAWAGQNVQAAEDTSGDEESEESEEE